MFQTLSDPCKVYKDSLKSYSNATARHAACKLYRKKQRLGEVELLADHLEAKHSDANDYNPFADPILHETFSEAVSSLPSYLREVFLGRWDGETYYEIAARAGCTKESAAMRYHRARSFVRDKIYSLLQQIDPELADLIFRKQSS